MVKKKQSKILSTKERVTPIRTKLLEILSKIKKPLTAQELLIELYKVGLKANKTTVYRQLDSLKESRLVSEVRFNDRNIRYELSDEHDHHHHLVCLNCKKVEDIILPDDLFHQEKVVWKKNKFKVFQHFLEFFGLCKNCQNKTK